MINFENVADRLADLPNCHALFSVWCKWRGNVVIPTRADVKPEMLGKALKSVTILELDKPDQIYFRIASTLDETLARRPLKGLNYVEMTNPANRQL